MNIDKILEDHKLWLKTSRKGQKANLSGANLSGTNLSGANLSGANLSGASLSGASLSGANLSGANLSGADLTGTILYRADLYRTNLSGANLTRANLSEANLTGADLSGTILLPFQIPEGDLIVWGKKNNILVKLLVPKEAKRTGTPIGRKCRAEFVKVLEVFNEQKRTVVENKYGTTVYEEGELVYPDSYNADIRLECTHGIHFFLTKEEAENW